MDVSDAMPVRGADDRSAAASGPPWYRVVEVGVPLYEDSAGSNRLSITAIRLEVVGTGHEDEHLVPTRGDHQVGHYASWLWSTEVIIGPAWARREPSGPLVRVWEHSAVFTGRPAPPVHTARVTSVTVEPPRLLLRVGDSVPVRVVEQVTDGTATWTRAHDGCAAVSDDEGVARPAHGAVVAADSGTTTVRCSLDGHRPTTEVVVAPHPPGTLTDFLTRLPPVTGVASTPGGLVVSTLGPHLLRVGANGALQRLAEFGTGIAALAARRDGELVIRLPSEPRLLVLHHDDYLDRGWVDAGTGRAPAAFTWADEDLITVSHAGVVHRVGIGGRSTPIATIGHSPPADIGWTGSDVLLLCAPAEVAYAERGGRALRGGVEGDPTRAHLWRIPVDAPEQAQDLLAGLDQTPRLSSVHCAGSAVLLGDFHGGRLFELRDGALSVITTGLAAPAQAAVGHGGDIYVADFGAGSVRRVLS
ncbi:hypothetical protein ACTG9Q_15725 [Actinokineospora sp. 24-640]